MFGNKKRRQELAALALSLGLSFAPEDDFGLRDWPFDLLSASIRRSRNVLWGPWRGRNLSVFDYEYNEILYRGSRASARIHRFSCALADVGVPLPRVRIEGHGGYVPFRTNREPQPLRTGDEPFDRTFRVIASDAGFAQRLLSQEIREALLRLGSGWSYEVADRGTMCSVRFLMPSAIPALLDALSAFIEALPAELLGPEPAGRG